MVSLGTTKLRATGAASRLFQNRDTRKQYLALLYGTLTPSNKLALPSTHSTIQDFWPPGSADLWGSNENRSIEVSCDCFTWESIYKLNRRS